jgi:hypothetical protein
VPKNPDELGALWIKTSGRGEYMTGTINGEAVVVFRNDKKSDKAPDWRVLKSRPKGESVNRSTGEIHEPVAKRSPAFDESEFPGDDIAF